MKSNLSFLYYPMLLLLLGVSFVSTSYGVLSYVTDVSSLASIDFLNIKVIVSLAVVFVITLFAFLFLDNFLNSRTIKAKMFFLFLYMISTTISIGFGYPFWWNILIANNTLNNKIDSATDKGLSNIKEIRNNLNISKQYTQKISEIAKKKKKIEIEKGSSCDGVTSPPGAGPYYNSRATITVKINDLVSKLTTINTDIENFSKKLITLTNKTRATTINSNDSAKIEKIINSYIGNYNERIDTIDRHLTIKIEEMSALINILKSATISTNNNKPIIMNEVPQDVRFRFEKGFNQCTDKDIYNTLITIEKNFSTIRNLDKSKLHMHIADKINRARKSLNGLLSVVPWFEFESNNKYDFSFISLLFTLIIDSGILVLTILINSRNKYQKTVEVANRWCQNTEDKENAMKILNNLVIKEKYIILPKEDGVDYIEFKFGNAIITHSNFMQIINIISNINNAVSLNPIANFPNSVDFRPIESVFHFEDNVKYIGYKINNFKVIEDIMRLLSDC